MRLFGFKKKTIPSSLPDISTLDDTALPILGACDLTKLLDLAPIIRSIERLSCVGAEYFNAMYLPAINDYIEAVQLAPASSAHHHAGLGGLITHTLDVTERALRLRKSYQLPLNAGPELVSRQAHIWTYAVFAGALLHDIGKMNTSTILELDTGDVWNPHCGNILNSGASTYRVSFCSSEYRYHNRIANSYFYLIPVTGRGWLSQNQTVFSELSAWLYGDIYEFGTIGKIVQDADRQSVASNLKLDGSRVRFSNAPTVPLVEKLMTALRSLIDDGSLKINGLDGSSGWCNEGFTYLVCGTVADKVRSRLASMGSTGIPGDNAQLFNIWQEHGYALANPRGSAVWTVLINNANRLTVLKFETSRIFHPSKIPGEFSGDIFVTDGSGANTEADLENIPETATSIASPTIRQQGECSAGAENVPGTSEGNLAKNNPFVATTSRPDIAAVGQDQSTFTASEDEPLPETINVNAKHAPAQIKPFEISDSKIDERFIEWLRVGLQERKHQVNNREAFIHIVKEGVLLVTPIAFKKFIWHYNLCREGDNINNQLKRVQERLKASMSKKKKHRRTSSGVNIHTYKINGSKNGAQIKCWLLPADEVFKNAASPGVNPVLENVSGFEN